MKWALNYQFLCSYIIPMLWFSVFWQACLSNLISTGPQNVSKGLWFIKRKDTNNSEQSTTARNISQKYSPPLQIYYRSCPRCMWQTTPLIWGRKLECFNSVNAEVTEWLQELDSGMYQHLYKPHDRLWIFSLYWVESQKPTGILRRNTLKRTKAKKWKANCPLRSKPQIKLQILICINILNIRNSKGKKKSQRNEAKSKVTKFASNIGAFGIEENCWLWRISERPYSSESKGRQNLT